MTSRLKTNAESIRVLDLVGTRNPASLALLMQLLNTDGNVLSLHEIRAKAPKRAVETLRQMGLVEVTKDIVQTVYLIESDIVESAVKAKRKEKKLTWKEMMRSKGGDPERVEQTIKGDSRAAVFYRNELAENWEESEAFKAYKAFTWFLFAGNFDEPFTRVLSIPKQVSYRKFVTTGMWSAMNEVKDIVKRMENYTKKDYADLTQAMSNWFDRRVNA